MIAEILWELHESTENRTENFHFITLQKMVWNSPKWDPTISLWNSMEAWRREKKQLPSPREDFLSFLFFPSTRTVCGWRPELALISPSIGELYQNELPQHIWESVEINMCFWVQYMQSVLEDGTTALTMKSVLGQRSVRSYVSLFFFVFSGQLSLWPKAISLFVEEICFSYYNQCLNHMPESWNAATLVLLVWKLEEQ